MMSRKATDKSLSAILQRQTTALVDDLRRRTEQEAAIKTQLDAEYKDAREGRRTAATYIVWREDVLPQVAVAWVLACVFVRFLEDNELIESPRLSGPVSPVDRRKHAIEAQEKYFQANPAHNERDFLEAVFHDIARLPGMTALRGSGNANLWRFGPSREGCVELLKLFRELDAGEEPKLRYDFRDAELSTRFLGDLYQNLSDHARKQYALLQTPDFIEEFILDRTLEPAIREFGLQGLRMIDPTVGSGHFLLGGFARLFDRWRAAEPATEPRVLAQRVLDSLYGVDLNPFAAEICRFRLLIVALNASGVKRLAEAPAFKLHVAIGDSLLHGPRYGDEGRAQEMFEREWVMGFTYEQEDVDELRRVFGQRYHAVVGNPPYITVKDKAMNALIRERYGSCKGKYALSVPFLERFVELAVPGEGARAAGFVGQITANSFMKREFGKRLIEEFLPRWDLTHVIDTSGAYIPGHGTPTVILFLRNQPPLGKTVRAVLGIRGEPTTPHDASQGHVWRAIVGQVDQPGSQSEFVSVEDKERVGFHHHPWSIGGGGAAELKELLDEAAIESISDRIDSAGFGLVLGEDEAFRFPCTSVQIRSVPRSRRRQFVQGELVRDWGYGVVDDVLYPYDELTQLAPAPAIERILWSMRTLLWARKTFANLTYRAAGKQFYEFHQIPKERNRAHQFIIWGEIATHNHFAMVREHCAFDKTAPMMLLRKGATEDDHLALLGLLNSSTACFWLKQVCHQKQMTGGDGVRIESRSKVPYAFNATALEKLPLPARLFEPEPRARLIELTRSMIELATQREARAAGHVISATRTVVELGSHWEQAQSEALDLRSSQVRVQEDIDFLVYWMYELVDEALISRGVTGNPGATLPGTRPFELLSGRSEEGYTVPGGVPIEWTDDLRSLWERRVSAIKSSADLRLIEDPHYKRRWIGIQGLFSHKAKTDELKAALREKMLDRIEQLEVWRSSAAAPTSLGRLVDLLSTDQEFQRLAEAHAEVSAPDVAGLLAELVSAHHVPFVAALRYKDTGLRKRAEWEKTWTLQREEDAIDARVELPTGNPLRLTAPKAAEEKARVIGDIPVPPKYISDDFQQSSYWSNRGKLDVPKERFISYPGFSTGEDPTLLVGWAGWDHAQQAQALAALYRERQQVGWDAERLRPLLAGLQELLPWLAQWHGNDPTFGDLGAFYRAYIETQCRDLGLEMHELSSWRPAAKSRGRRANVQGEDAAEATPLFEAE
jgi:hypothetical protein